MFHNRTKTVKGFTLIELLVVISIIALLVSVLMPALNRAKDNAKRTVCASNQKSIGQAVMLYASSNDDKLPRNEANPGYEYTKIGDGAPHRSYMMFEINRDASLQPWDRVIGTMGMGLLMNKIIDTPETFYCEGVPRQRQGGSGTYTSLAFRYEDYDLGGGFPWSPDDMINNHMIRSSYNFMPQSRKKKGGLNVSVSWRAGTSSSYTVAEAQADGGIFRNGQEIFPEVAKSTSELYGDFAIASGVIHGIEFLPHKMGSGKNAASGINMLYGDCSVRFGNDLKASQSVLWDAEDLGTQEYVFRKLYSLFQN